MQTTRTFTLADTVLVVTLKTSTTPTRQHRFSEQGDDTLMDGKVAHGIDGPPRRETLVILSRFSVSFGKQQVDVLKSLPFYLLHCPLTWAETSQETNKNLLLIPAPKGKSVLFRIGGGDGAGSYTAWLVIDPTGVRNTFVEGPA